MNKLFSYPGGKWPIRNKIIALFPAHKTYIDLFGGSASILIAKPPSEGEVFNDKNEEIVNFFRVVKHRPAELAEKARFWIHSRALWNEKKKDPVILKDEIARAVKFWVLIQDCFGAQMDTYGTSREGVRSVTKAREHLAQVAERLKNVHVECLDFWACISRYDGAASFFYCDPPYLGTDGGSSNYDQLSEAEWRVLAELLRDLKGKFLLSHIDHPLVLKLFRGFEIIRIQVPVSLPKGANSSKRTELLISNYNIRTEQKKGGSSNRKDRFQTLRAKQSPASQCLSNSHFRIDKLPPRV